jgi:hypothetical protein
MVTRRPISAGQMSTRASPPVRQPRPCVTRNPLQPAARLVGTVTPGRRY